MNTINTNFNTYRSNSTTLTSLGATDCQYTCPSCILKITVDWMTSQSLVSVQYFKPQYIIQ